MDDYSDFYEMYLALIHEEKYTPSKIDDSEIIKMAESAEPVK